MSRKKGVPSSAIDRKMSKDVRKIEVSSDLRPSWRFSTVDLGGPFAWPLGTAAELEIVGKLHSFDSMNWSEFTGSDHHNLNPYTLSELAVKRLQEIGRDDEIDQIFSFHLQGKPRLICIRDRNIAKLLWYDPEHKVCPSIKK